MDYDTRQMIQKLFDDENSQNILLGVEEYFDNMDLYVFENWIDGEIVEGPISSKYWVEITLKYNLDKMPDPRGAYLFANQGTKIEVRKDVELVPKDFATDHNDFDPENPRKVQMDEVPVILVKFTIPRRLVDASGVEEYQLMDDELEQESAEAMAQMTEAIPVEPEGEEGLDDEEQM